MRLPFVPAVCASAGLVAGYFLGSDPAVGVARQAPPPPAFTMDHRVGANLWVMNAAEYRACCLQTYRHAADRLERVVAAPNPPPKPAVIMDLDETVLDNSAFQTALYAADKEYDPKLWDVYEKSYPVDVRLVPGAKAFIDRAAQLGVTVVFLSNRSEKLRAGTVAALKHLKLADGDPGERLLLKTTTSDKTARREQVGAKFNVVMLVGDNLRDFSETFAAPKFGPADGPEAFQKATAARNAAADAAAAHWGVDWIVLPNPVYGEWEKLIGPDPKAGFTPTTMDLTKPAAE
jgi:acid phosphatase